MYLFLGEDDDGAERGSANQLQESLYVETIQISTQVGSGKTNMAQHQFGHWSAPWTHPQPTTSIPRAIANDMNVHIDWLGISGILPANATILT
jgi:hypothetical protein